MSVTHDNDILPVGEPEIISIQRDALTKVPLGWEDFFSSQSSKLRRIDMTLTEDKCTSIQPSVDLVFNVFHMVEPENIKIIILGQDPYPTDGMANGVSFSTPAHFKVQPSLANVFKEIKREYPEWQIPGHGDLYKWVTQGVFLLNTSLTRNPNINQASPDQHFKKKLWLPFIVEVISYIKRINPMVLFVTWGASARSTLKSCTFKKLKVDNVFDCNHPSPMNCTPSDKSFDGCDHFIKINNRLMSLNIDPVEW